MKKVLLFVIPLLIALIVFFAILFYLDRNSAKGALKVTSLPKSEVYLNNKLIGETPLCLCEVSQMLSVGDYSIKLIPRDVNKTYEAKITINKSTLTVVDRTFLKEGNSEGSVITLSTLSSKKDIEISVESIPANANVFLNNNPVGITTLLLKNVSEGNHDLRLNKEGFKDKLIKVSTTLGYRLTSKVFLGAAPSGGIASSSASLAVKKVLILDTPTGFLRVRESNSISSLEIGKVNPGETYELLDEKDGWFEIKLSSPSREIKNGWISSQYAKKE